MRLSACLIVGSDVRKIRSVLSRHRSPVLKASYAILGLPSPGVEETPAVLRANRP